MGSNKNTISWLQNNFTVSRVIHNNGEVIMNCPSCSREKFYFNTNKLVGHCKHASCNIVLKLRDLQKYARTPITGLIKTTPIIEEKPSPIELPGEPISNNLKQGYLARRGVCSDCQDSIPFKYHAGRLLIPVYDIEGKTMQFVGRALDKSVYLRYLYSSKNRISDYILMYETGSHFDKIEKRKCILVENSFNAMALRCSGLPGNTSFGSHISDRQIILLSKLYDKIIILWDEGAEEKAVKCSKKLREKGINTIVATLKGQPDDHFSNEFFKLLEALLTIRLDEIININKTKEAYEAKDRYGKDSIIIPRTIT